MEKNQNGYPARNGSGMSTQSPRSGSGGTNTREENWRDMAEQNERMSRQGSCNQGDMNGVANGVTPGNNRGCTDGCNRDSQGIGSLALAYAYVPMQKFRLLYNPEKALARGTLFEELDLPLGVYNNGK